MLSRCIENINTEELDLFSLLVETGKLGHTHQWVFGGRIFMGTNTHVPSCSSASLVVENISGWYVVYTGEVSCVDGGC